MSQKVSVDDTVIADTTNTVDTTDTQINVVEEEIVYPVQLTIEQATAINVVVNKKHKLPDNYVPTTVSVAGGKLRQEAATELTKLLNAVRKPPVRHLLSLVLIVHI